jgi:hypothetical protein
MKKIGEGYYYNVFEKSTDTVVKTLKSKPRIFLFIFFAKKFNIVITRQEYNKVLSSIPQLKTTYEKILSAIPDKSIIGNPVFTNETDYTQDKVKELRNINSLNENDFSNVIKAYTHLLKTLWSYGVSDSIFNFSLNCGYSKNNELILIDFNEMTFEKDEISSQIKNKIWLQRSSYLHLTKEKQELFNTIFDKEISQEILEKNWVEKQ